MATATFIVLASTDPPRDAGSRRGVRLVEGRGRHAERAGELGASRDARRGRAPAQLRHGQSRGHHTHTHTHTHTQEGAPGSLSYGRSDPHPHGHQISPPIFCCPREGVPGFLGSNFHCLGDDRRDSSTWSLNHASNFLKFCLTIEQWLVLSLLLGGGR